MELKKEMIEDLIKQKELERLFIKDMGVDDRRAATLATFVMNYKTKIQDILSSEYKIEVTKL